MTLNLLLNNISRHIILSEKDRKRIASRFTLREIKKKDFLLKEGHVAKDVAFVLSGCLRSYSVDENGFEHILQFAPSDWWITDMYSFISQKKAYLNIEVINSGEVALLSRHNQLQLFDEVPSLERYFRIITENALVSSRQRLIDNLSLTARQRYEQFCITYPTMVNDIPQKLIAAYIGVTPEFLSKMRSELLKEK
jgi:CRP-like cAMP-binding protein